MLIYNKIEILFYIHKIFLFNKCLKYLLLIVNTVKYL